MPKTASKKTIAVDIDDVLAANAEGFIEFSNERWGTNLSPGDYTEHWAELWQISHDETLKRRELVFKEGLFLKHRFFDDAKPVLQQLAKNYNLIIISSRNKLIQKETIAWIKKEYGELFSGIYFADMWDKSDLKLEERLKRTKTEVLKTLSADYLIDDQPKHCIAAANAGITALLFGNYKWNKDIQSVPNMLKIKDWQGVLEYFDAESRQ